MANDPKKLRKAYEFKIGKDRADKLSDQQISLLSKYYNSLSDDEQRNIDTKIFKGVKNDLFEMADAFIEEKKQTPKKKTATATKPKTPKVPKGFDELIDEIQGKKPPKVTEEDIIEEKINSRIIELLGLDPSIPIDYGMYKSLLVEKLKSFQFLKVQPKTEDIELLINEYKRIKKNTSNIIFKVKAKKVSPQKLITRYAEPSKRYREKNKYILSTKSLEKDSEIKKDNKLGLGDSKILDNIVSINESVSGILSYLEERKKLEKSSKEKQRKKTEGDKRKKKEDRFEKLKKVTSNFVSKVLTPVKTAFEAILNFLQWVVIGRLGGKVLDWFMDPKNNEKIASLGRFLSDWWPAILGAFVMFTNPLGGFIKNVVGLVTKFTIQILRVAIPKIISLARKNPKLAAAMVLFGAGAAAEFIPGMTGSQESKVEAAPGSNEEKIRQLKEQKESMNWFQKNIMGGGAEIDEQIYNLEKGQPKKYRTGGQVTGSSGEDITGAGVDTQLIAARPGEVVINKETVDALGANYFLSLNKKYGGSNANKPKIARNVQTASGGGLVLQAFANGGRVGETNEKPVGGSYMGRRSSQIDRYYSGFGGGSSKQSGNDPLSGVKSFIKYKLGYDIDRPNTWGKSFRSGVDSIFGESVDKKPSGSVVGPILDASEGVKKYGSGLANQGLDLANQGLGLFNQGYNYAKLKGGELLLSANRSKNKLIDTSYGKLFSGMQRAEESKYVTPEQFAKLSEAQKLDVLIKDPNSSGTRTALTLRNQIAQDKEAEFIRGLYDPEKDKGAAGFVKKQYQDIMNRGLLPTMNIPRSMDSTIGDLTKGKVKNASAINAAVQMTIKGLLGPLGKPFRVDASPILEYNKPLMDFAIKNKLMDKGGNYLVGKESWSKSLGDKAYEMVKDPKTGKMVRGEHLYDKMQRESAGSGAAAKLANFGLGQFSFKVGRDGKAIVNDSWDSNQTAGYYFDQSREALKKGDIYNALFKGFSGVLRINQNSAFGLGNRGAMNTTPAGIDIKSQSTFDDVMNKRPDALNKDKIKKSKNIMQGQSQVTMYGANDPRRKNTSRTTMQGQTAVTLYGSNDPRKKAKREWYDPRGWFGKQGGGMIKENTGMNIMGATADRQLIAAQPGEYILPVDFVNSVGVSAIDKLVAYFDSNSNAAKMGNKSVNVNIPGPRFSSSKVKTLPPIMQSSGGGSSMGRGGDQGTNVPNFNVISPSSLPSRQERMSLYGILD
jgi:hypothetical protein